MSDTIVYECSELVRDCAPNIEVPDWVRQDITAEVVAAIIEHGLDSGVYMDAVLGHKAVDTMSCCGNSVMEYLEDTTGEIPPIPNGSCSWTELAMHYLGAAIVVWAVETEPKLRRALEAREAFAEEAARNPVLYDNSKVEIDSRLCQRVNERGRSIGCETSVWSIYTASAINSLLELESVAIEGPIVLVYDDVLGEYYVQEIMCDEEITFQQLWKAADRLIERSGDLHHIFIENFKPYGTIDGMTAIELVTGS